MHNYRKLLKDIRIRGITRAEPVPRETWRHPFFFSILFFFKNRKIYYKFIEHLGRMHGMDHDVLRRWMKSYTQSTAASWYKRRAKNQYRYTRTLTFTFSHLTRTREMREAGRREWGYWRLKESREKKSGGVYILHIVLVHCKLFFTARVVENIHNA